MMMRRDGLAMDTVFGWYGARQVLIMRCGFYSVGSYSSQSNVTCCIQLLSPGSSDPRRLLINGVCLSAAMTPDRHFRFNAGLFDQAFGLPSSSSSLRCSLSDRLSKSEVAASSSVPSVGAIVCRGVPVYVRSLHGTEKVNRRTVRRSSRSTAPIFEVQAKRTAECCDEVPFDRARAPLRLHILSPCRSSRVIANLTLNSLKSTDECARSKCARALCFQIVSEVGSVLEHTGQ